MDLCPWADVVYGCDAAWWKHRRGLPEFNGLKITWAGNSFPEYPHIAGVKIAHGKRDKYTDDLVLDPGSIGGGGNSGFQALNLAVHFGAKRILLIGFDMHGNNGAHWYGRNHWPMANNPAESNFKRWIAAFNGAAPVLERMGIEVVNANPMSALKCFRFA